VNALVVADSPVARETAGLAPRLLAFLAQASSFERADAINALARSYLHCDLKPQTRAEAELALTCALDDPDPRVRRALAEALADAREAPRALVLALAHDVSCVARPVLAQSPLLRDADLVDCAAIGDAAAQSAIARRARLSAAVAAALAEVGERAAVLTLIGNLGAEIATPSLWRALERFPRDPELRARLVERPALPAALRAAVAAEAAEECAAAEWLDPRRAERIARDGREQAFVAIARGCAGAELAELVAWLRREGHLTVGLLLRALACGEKPLFAQSLADMAGVSAARVAGLVAQPQGAGFAALYARARMPAHLLPAFRIAAFAARDAVPGVGVDYRLARSMLRAMEALKDPALAPVETLLWRLASEAARAEAREAAALALAADEAAEVAPLRLEPSAPPVLALNVEPGNENHAPPVAIDDPLAELAVLAA
jgi:uncharacterized protein (DUF2336 family)